MVFNFFFKLTFAAGWRSAACAYDVQMRSGCAGGPLGE